MTNISAAVQGRRVIKYTSKNDPRPRRSAAKSKNFATEGDSSDNDPTPYLLQAINNNNPRSSSRGHREKRASINNVPKNANGDTMEKGATQKMPPPQKIRARLNTGDTAGTRHGGRRAEPRARTTTTHYLPPHPQNIHHYNHRKPTSKKGTTCEMPPPPKIRGQSQKRRGDGAGPATEGTEWQRRG